MRFSVQLYLSCCDGSRGIADFMRCLGGGSLNFQSGNKFVQFSFVSQASNGFLEVFIRWPYVEFVCLWPPCWPIEAGLRRRPILLPGDEFWQVNAPAHPAQVQRSAKSRLGIKGIGAGNPGT